MATTIVRSSWKNDSSRIYDLEAIFSKLNQMYFSGKLQTKIIWSRQAKTKARCYRRLGSFSPMQNLIRINPILDDSDVPDYFIEYIVYHEMLHAVYPPIAIGKRRWVHHKKFIEMEQTFPMYPQAKAWEKGEGKRKFF